MKCDEIRELLSLYIDNMLDESQARAVEEHLSACEHCRKEYDELKEMLDLLGQTEMVSVPDEFQFRLKKGLKEEKQSMITAGIIKPAKKKNRWHIVTSIAAVFAVGVLSFGLYHDVLGILPDKLGVGEQSGTASAPEQSNDAKPADSEAMNKMVGDTADSSSSDGSVVMKEQASDLQPMSKESDLSLAGGTGEGDLPMQTYGIAADPEADAGDDSAEAVTEAESAAGSMGFDGDQARNSKLAPALDECSRSLNVSGVERNTAAVQFYNGLIEERLSGFDYQILESNYAQTGEWQFRIFIFRGKDGNTYNEEILIIGKDGEIKVICSNEFMGL